MKAPFRVFTVRGPESGRELWYMVPWNLDFRFARLVRILPAAERRPLTIKTVLAACAAGLFLWYWAVRAFVWWVFP
jgi:hypothetical protein